MSLSLQKGQGIEMRRRRQTFHATSVGSYVSTGSSQVRIEINIDKEVIDFDTGYLMFDMVGATANTASFLPQAASSWIRDLRVYDRAGREIGEQVRQYNGMARKQAELLGNDGANANYLAALEGANETSAGLGTAATSREYAHKFVTHIFDIKSYFPAHLLGGLIIEMDMEDHANVLTDSAAGAITSYTLSNVRYVTDLVLLKPEAEAELRSQVAQGGLEVHYESAMNHSQAVTTNTNQRFDLGIANGSVKSIQSFMVKNDFSANQDASELRSATDEDYWSVFSQNSLSSYRFRLGSEYLTEKDVQISATRLSEYLVEYLKSENLDSSDVKHFYGDSALVLADRFTVGQKVEISKDPNVASGRRDLQSNKIEAELVFSTTPDSGTLYTNIMLDKVLKIMAGREFINVQ